MEKIKPVELNVIPVEKEDPYAGTYKIQSQEVNIPDAGPNPIINDIGLPEIRNISSQEEFELLIKEIREFNESQIRLTKENQLSRYLMKVIRN